MNADNKYSAKILSKINEKIEMPSGLLCGGIHIELNSNREVLLDGKCTVLEYTQQAIRLNSGDGIIVIYGNMLNIVSMHPSGVEINGRIDSVGFES